MLGERLHVEDFPDETSESEPEPDEPGDPADPGDTPRVAGDGDASSADGDDSEWNRSLISPLAGGSDRAALVYDSAIN
eukprot:CAMPEP_0185582688 /NCGR_PEP_ID=MMETSP0434-20130131/21058_1 /TAXON_ID=626734 ORGANISM="Favella taraikaensis, Strain Fe Narragansett Bay" /NCGR_SAMPLE_ID=MMETSP0434 /ASSEMBLY_ACC=CAM_ASM_000379 /LENGTH=77 /DNA_ID=CAMNT_0028201577 /DNA_START=1737 /DNA_END=1970 /DNA_ORIENTATION=-